MDIYDGIAAGIEWIQNLGNAAQTITSGGVEWTAQWFETAANSIAAAIGSILFYAFQSIIDFCLGWAYIFSRLYEIIDYLVRPLAFYGLLLEGVIENLSNPITLSNPVTFDSSIVAAIMNISGVSIFVDLLYVCFWYLVFHKTLKTLKN